MLRPLSPPDLFPPFVRQRSLAYDPDLALDAALTDGVALPTELANAVSKRRVEFLAGRLCAREALRALAPDLAETEIPVAASRAPRWPAGVVGAITHAHGLASAAVALDRDAVGLGLDSEVCMRAGTFSRVLPRIATPSEIERIVRGGVLDERLALTLIFSAKEAIYKCLAPRVGRYFDFLDAELTALDLDARTFVARLLTPLPSAPAVGAPLEGRVVLDGERVHTGLVLAR